MIPQLIWYEYSDEDDSPTYEAASIYHCDGFSLYFKIVKGDDGTFTEQSEAELVTGPRRTWRTLSAAKADIQADHERMYAEALAQATNNTRAGNR